MPNITITSIDMAEQLAEKAVDEMDMSALVDYAKAMLADYYLGLDYCELEKQYNEQLLQDVPVGQPVIEAELPELDADRCLCDIQTLMSTGCRCGGK